MNAFETTAVIEDASHLSLREPVPSSAARECRVIVLFEEENGHLSEARRVMRERFAAPDWEFTVGVPMSRDERNARG